MLMVLPIVAAVDDRVTALEQAGRLPARIRAILSDLTIWLATDSDDFDGAARLRERINAVAPVLGRSPD
ncbi:hypothetical protein ACU4GR_10825 [Methylobacterium oryzae CBMB20]